jgi:hypothetical protein
MATEAADIPEELLNAQTQGVEDEVRRTMSEPKCACLLGTSPGPFLILFTTQTILETSLTLLV